MTRQYAKNGDVVERAVREEQLLIPLRSEAARLDHLFALNETAGFIWRALSEGLSETETAARLTRTYDLAPDTAVADVRRLADELVRLDLLRPRDAQE